LISVVSSGCLLITLKKAPRSQVSASGGILAGAGA